MADKVPETDSDGFPTNTQRADTAIENDLTAHTERVNTSHNKTDARESLPRQMSAPPYASPLRHHQRAPSRSRAVKETLNARSHHGSSDDDGVAVHRINQYVIKQEIGRGSFGAVHLAVDQFGNEYAIKEFSKSRLRKRAQSNLLRRPNAGRRHAHVAAGLGFNSPLHRREGSSRLDVRQPQQDSLDLIKEEIAIMKKLNHNNVVSLLEVLDDPEEDSLYMVLEMCQKGVVMKVGLDDRAVPYDEETCRCWFRDMILGIEYLHAQGIVHRDIKPDNCLINADDVLKIVDFGVSEMFEKDSDMSTRKSAGSPAFMPPELCVARHGSISGTSADIWSMGVTLYCLRYGHIPFEKSNMLDLYESIRTEDVPLDDESNADFVDLMRQILCKNPDHRITMARLRDHPWVTKRATDPLLSAEENCADIVSPPTQADMERAITGNMANIMVVMKAARRFKDLLFRRASNSGRTSFLGGNFRMVAPPQNIIQDIASAPSTPMAVDGNESRQPARSNEALTCEPTSTDNTSEAQSRETEAHFRQRMETMRHHPLAKEQHPTEVASHGKNVSYDEHAKGHAHDPRKDTLFLEIGAGQSKQSDATEPDNIQFVVSESPPAVDTGIYEQAYQDEMKRIVERREGASVYLTRRVEHREDLRNHKSVLDTAVAGSQEAFARVRAAGGSGLAGLVDAARSASEGRQADRVRAAGGYGLASLVDAARSATRQTEPVSENAQADSD